MNLTIKLTGSQAWAWSMSKMITLDQRMMSISLCYLIAITSKQADINQWVFAASKISWESGTLEKHLNNCIIHLPTYLPTFQMTYLCFRAASMGSSFLLSPFPPFSSSFPLSLLMLRAAASSALAFKSPQFNIYSAASAMWLDHEEWSLAWKKRSLLSVPEDLEFN